MVYDGVLRVDYRQFYVWSDQDGGGSEDFTGGQQNGLCGAKVAGALFLTTATHWGVVGLRVETLPAAVAPEPDAEDIVEVSFRPNTSEIMVVPWGDAPVARFELPLGWYRVRYSLFHVQAAIDVNDDVERDYEQVIDRYLLQFWPEPSARADEIVRVSGPWAQYWHDDAQGITREAPAPEPPTAERLWAQAFTGAPQPVRARVLAWLASEIADRFRAVDTDIAEALRGSFPPDEASYERLKAARNHFGASIGPNKDKRERAEWDKALYLLDFVCSVHSLASNVWLPKITDPADLLTPSVNGAAIALADAWPRVLQQLWRVVSTDV